MAHAIDIGMLAGVLGAIHLEPGRLEAVARAAAGHSPKAIRLNRLAGVGPEQVGFAVEPVPWLAGWGYWPAGDVQPGRTIAYGAGLYYVQDAGSMLAVRLLDVQPGEVVCDLCAAPGGKTTAICEALGDSGGVLANEAIRGRTDVLRLNLARQGASRFVVTSLDPEDLAERLAGAFDAVLADVPCSGQSLVGAGKQKITCFDAKWVDHSAARQQRILAAAARLVRSGGRLVYSTCTFSWAENEGQIERFVAEHPEFEPAPDDRLGPWESPPPAPAGCYRLWPDRDRAAGAFAARLVRTGPAPVMAETRRCVGAPVNCRHGAAPGKRRYGDRRAPRRGGASRVTRAIPAGEPPWDEWGTWARPVRIVPVGPRQVAAVPEDLPDRLMDLVETGAAAGLAEGAQQFGKVWQPAYGLAMRRDGAFGAAQRVVLSDSEASTYLRGQTIPCDLRGWGIAVWNGWPLGWLHGAGRLASNKLDKAARMSVIS